MNPPPATATASPAPQPYHGKLARAESVDGTMLPISSFSSIPKHPGSSSFHDVTAASSNTNLHKPPTSGSSSTSSSSSSSSAPPRAPSSMRGSISASAAAAHATHSAAALRERSNSWAVPSSSTATSRSSYFPGMGHTMDTSSATKLNREITKAVQVVETFLSPKLLKDQSIPKELLVEAYGLVFLTVYKIGFLFSGKIGNGFIISRTTGGWSAPSFITSGGLGFGMMAGGEMVNYMVILNSRSAVKVFTRNGQFQLGSELDLAVGPIGRAASASVNIGRGGIAPNYSYSHSMGLYGGIGLTSAVIGTRKSLNAKCYGPNVTGRQILGGEVPCPLAVPLWETLDKALGVTRQYADGFPVLMPTATGLSCDSCGHVNSSESHQCSQCRSLLVYSVSVHSGRRNVGELVVTTNHGSSNNDAAAVGGGAAAV